MRPTGKSNELDSISVCRATASARRQSTFLGFPPEGASASTLAIPQPMNATGVIETMTDITNIRIIYAKGFLFLVGGVSASTLLIIENPDSKVILLLILSVWCFARFYYFAFYVIGKYVDSSYKFSGLWSFVVYLFRKRSRSPGT